MKYRSVAPLATAVSVAVVANLGLPLLFDGFAARQAWLATILTAGVLTLLFVYRAACNLAEIGDGHARFTPGQSVGWLLVPLVNLYLSHQVLTALWRDSQPQPRDARHRGSDFSVVAVNVWFAAMLASMASPHIVRDFHVGSVGPVIIDALRIAQGVAYIVVVLGIATRQREQWADLERRRSVPQPTAAALR